MKLKILFFKNYRTYLFNPFGGLKEEELEHVFVPVLEIEKLVEIIRNGPPSIIEFVGKMGRGKTTHLIFLQKFFPDTKIQLLEKGELFFPETETGLLFIDSIGEVPFLKRIKLYRDSKVTIVFSTHFSRRAESAFFRKPFFSFRVKGLTSERLKIILEKRIELAASKSYDGVIFTNEIADFLVNKYNDDLRSILRFLYLKFETESPKK